MSEILILSAENIRQALPMRECIEGMKQAFAALSTGQADVPLRARVGVPKEDAVALFMPAAVGDDLAIKVVSVFPKNVQRGEPMIYASVLVLDSGSGRPLALLEGGSLTAIRTGAGGGASVDLLARPEAKTLAIIGSGVQARTGAAAVMAVRSIETVRVYGRSRARAEAFAAELAKSGPIAPQVTVAASPSAAVRGADIVYTATTSTTPTFDSADLQAGAHVVGVGSYTPQMQEVDAALVQRALVVVDSREAALEEAGDLLVPMAEGLFSAENIHAELGEIAAGTKLGRSDAEQITFFKSVGVAVQDVVAARIALQNARQLGIGTTVAL